MDLVLKRVMAYIIDILIVMIVTSMIGNLSIINPYVDEYQENYDEYMEIVGQAQDEGSAFDAEEYEDNIISLYYNINKYNVVRSCISIVGTLLYFVVLQWALKGQTIGKKIMKIKVVAKSDDRELNIGNYFVRSLILNSIIFSVLFIVGVYIFEAQGYYTFAMVISYLQTLVITIIMLMVVLRKDFRGLHDMLAGTKVIDLNPATVMEEPEKIEEKQVIETKEIEVKEKKVTKSKSGSKNNTKKKSDSKSKKEK